MTLPTISMVDCTSWEGSEVVIQLKLDRASSQPITVNYAVAFESPAPSTHTSASADDFENLNTRPLTGTVTVAPGAVEQFALVDTADDTTWEGNEAFKVLFSNPVGAQLDPARNYASGFIAENDPAPPPAPVPGVSDNPGNDAPVVSNASVYSTYTEGDAPLRVASGITLSDVDDTHLEQAAVWFSYYPEFARGEDYLGFVSQNGITGSFGGHGSDNYLFLSGSATVADYQAALRSVTYSNPSENPTVFADARQIAFAVFDGEAWSASDPSSGVPPSRVWVVPVNDEPRIATPLPDATAKEGQSFIYTVPANTFVDVDGSGPFSYLVAKGDGTALPGWLTFDAATRTFSGTPDYDAQGTLTVVVTAQEAGGGLSATDRFDIVVQDTPVATPVPTQQTITLELTNRSGPVLEGNPGDGLSDLYFQVFANTSDGQPLTRDVAFAGNTVDGTATAGDFPRSVDDYGPLLNYEMVFSTGEFSGASRWVTVQIYPDASPERDETLTFVISSPVGAVLGVSSVTGVIVNDDPLV